MKEKRGRESTLRVELKWPYLCISSFDRAGFWTNYDPHHPLTSDHWDRKAMVLCERYSPRTVQENIVYRPVMVTGGLLFHQPLDPAQFWICWSY
jgi:hypothetical protein